MLLSRAPVSESSWLRFGRLPVARTLVHSSGCGEHYWQLARANGHDFRCEQFLADSEGLQNAGMFSL